MLVYMLHMCAHTGMYAYQSQTRPELLQLSVAAAAWAVAAVYIGVLILVCMQASKATVNVRTRDNVVHGEMKIPDLHRKLAADIAAFL